MTEQLTGHSIGTREEWIAARDQLLVPKRSTPGSATTSPDNDMSRPGSRSRRSTASTPTTAISRSRSCIRRAIPAARLPLHVRPELRGGLPGQLVDGRRCRQRAPASARSRRDVRVRLTSTPGEAPGLQAPNGLELSWASSTSDFNADLGFSHTEQEGREAVAAMMKGGGLPPIVEHNARSSGTDVAGYRPRARVRCLRTRCRHRLIRTRRRGGIGVPRDLLPDPRPRAEGRDEGDDDWQLWIRRHDEYEGT